MRNAPAIFVVLTLCGCTETRTEKQTQVDRRDDLHTYGSISLPVGNGGMLVPIPFEVTTERIGTESQNEKGSQETKISEAAIKQIVGPVVNAALAGAGIRLPSLGAASGALGALGGVTPGEAGGAVGALLAALLALQQMLERRKRERTLEEVKQQRDEAQERALRYAEQVNPKSTEAS